MKKQILLIPVLALLLLAGPAEAAKQRGTLNIAIPQIVTNLEDLHGVSGKPLAQLKLTATDSNITFYRMSFKQSGRSERTDFRKLWATFDGERSYPGYVNSNGLVSFRFKGPQSLPKDDVKTLSIYGEIKAGSHNGKNVMFTPVSIRSTAKTQIVTSWKK